MLTSTRIMLTKISVLDKVQENSNMWAFLTTEIAQPILEFDFIGCDGFDVLGKTGDNVKPTNQADRLDFRSRQGRKQVNPYT